MNDQPNQATDLLHDPTAGIPGQDQAQPCAPGPEAESAASAALPEANGMAGQPQPLIETADHRTTEVAAAEAPATEPPTVEQPIVPVVQGEQTFPVQEQVAAAQEQAPPVQEQAPTAQEPAPPVKVQAPPVQSAPPVAPAKPASKKPKGKAAKAEPAVELPSGPKSDKMDWYILKVQSNREESIREGLLRRVRMAGLDMYFGDIIVPTEKVAEFRGGKKREVKRKLYPGYLVVQMEINEDTWFLVRETPGIGDFTGASGHPSPMLPHEIARILAKKETIGGPAPKLQIGFGVGDRVKITEGTFENFEGEVSSIDEASGRVTVMITIFNRTTPVELEYWQIEAV